MTISKLHTRLHRFELLVAEAAELECLIWQKIIVSMSHRYIYGIREGIAWIDS